MNKTAELVIAWAEYETTHSNAGIDDFCHAYIINKRAKEKSKMLLGGNLPPDSYSVMAKMIGRLSKLHNTYAVIALKECGLNNLDEFLYLNSIGNAEAPKKTTVIYANFNELSSGLLILGRMMKKGLIVEATDKEDKRSKRLKLTKKGNNLLTLCYEKMGVLNEWFFKSISKEDIDLCVHLLSGVETNFSSKWVEDKAKTFGMLNEE